MQRVHGALLGDGLLGRRQRLTQHLAAEHAPPAQVLALPAEDVLLDALEAQDLDQLGQDVAHRYSEPSGARARNGYLVRSCARPSTACAISSRGDSMVTAMVSLASLTSKLVSGSASGENAMKVRGKPNAAARA